MKNVGSLTPVQMKAVTLEETGREDELIITLEHYFTISDSKIPAECNMTSKICRDVNEYLNV